MVSAFRGDKIFVFHTWNRVVWAMERVRSKNLYINIFTRNELWNFRLMVLTTLVLMYGFSLLSKPKRVQCHRITHVHNYTTLFALRLFRGKSFIWFCLDILTRILWGILFGSASRVNWDKLTASEMVQDIESFGQRDWFICHIFWVYGLETTTL